VTDNMEINIEEDENEPELIYPYKEVDPLNPLSPASESKLNDEIEVENPIDHEDKTIPVSVYETAYALVEKKSEAKDKFYSKLILDLGNEVHCVVTKLNPQIMPPKSAPMTQAAMHRLIKESVDAAIAAERERQAKVRNDASGSGPVRGQDNAPVVRECTFAWFMKCNPTAFRGIEGVVELRRWFEKTESVLESVNVQRARSEKIGDSSQMVTSVSILEERSK
ncbi:hypothetical protein Tco_1443968, partial [Tanacetum coccineum]